MTLDIRKLFKNLIEKQFSISHLELKTEIFKKEALPKNIKKLITDKWSDKFLLDCDYIAFFKGAIDKKIMQRLYTAVNSSLGDDANLLTKGDLKTLNLEVNGSVQKQSEPEEEEPIEEPEEEVQNEPEDEEADKQNSQAIEDALNEDEELANVQPVAPTRFVFLKITLKK